MYLYKGDGGNSPSPFLDKNMYYYTEYKISNKPVYLLSCIAFEMDGEYERNNITHKFEGDKHIFTVYDSRTSYKHVYCNDNIVKVVVNHFENKERECRYYYY